MVEEEGLKGEISVFSHLLFAPFAVDVVDLSFYRGILTFLLSPPQLLIFYTRREHSTVHQLPTLP